MEILVFLRKCGLHLSRPARLPESACQKELRAALHLLSLDVDGRLLLGICFRARRTVDGQNGDRCRGVRGSGLALDIAESRAGQFGMARALERFIQHILGERVTITPVPVIEDRNWTWHVGLDAEATRIANALWNGKKVKQADLARIIWLGVLEFADPTRVIQRARGKPVYLALAVDAAQKVRMKPQNLATGLPLTEAEKAA